MKTNLNRSIILAAIVFLSACKNEQQPKNFIVPIDFSSSRDSTIINWYGETVVNSLLQQAGMKDKLTILPVDFNSELWSQEIFKIDFSQFEYGNEFAGLQKDEIEKKNFQDTVTGAIRNFTICFDSARNERKGFDRGSDVLGALKQCQKYVSAHHQNIIVLFCDMQQYSGKRDFDLENNLKEEKIQKYLDTIEPIDLGNSKIIVLTGPQINISATKFNLVKRFWEEYFKKCNAELIDYSTGAVSKLEETVLAKNE